MPGIQRYKIHPQRDIIHEVTGLKRVGCWRSQNSMADSSTTTAPILDPITGDCWPRRRLRNGIKDVSVASKLRKSLTLVRVVFIGTLAISELDGRFLHDHTSDHGPDCGRLLGSTPVVFITGRGRAGFHFVTPPLLRPGVNSLPFLPAPYDTGPWLGCGAGRVFYFPR